MAKGGIALIFESKWASKPLGSPGFNRLTLPDQLLPEISNNRQEAQKHLLLSINRTTGTSSFILFWYLCHHHFSRRCLCQTNAPQLSVFLFPSFQSKAFVSKLTHLSNSCQFFLFPSLGKKQKTENVSEFATICWRNIVQLYHCKGKLEKYSAPLYYCEIYPCNGKVHHKMMSTNACSLSSRTYKWLPIYMGKNTPSLLYAFWLICGKGCWIYQSPKTVPNFD